MKFIKKLRKNVGSGRTTYGWKNRLIATVILSVIVATVMTTLLVMRPQATTEFSAIETPEPKPTENLPSTTLIPIEETAIPKPTEEPISYIETIMYTTSSVNLRQNTSKSSTSLLIIPESVKVSAQIPENSTIEEWTQVTYKGKSGYVKTEYLAFYDEDFHLDNLQLEYKYQDLVDDLIEAFDFDVDVYFFYGMMYTENRFKMEPESEAGAQGILQVIPSTWRTMYKELQREYPEIAATIVDDPIDKASNITIGLYYIKYLKDYYGYSSLKEHASQILTCYNRGPGGTASYYNKYGTYSTDYSKEILRAADYIRENGTWEEGL